MSKALSRICFVILRRFLSSLVKGRSHRLDDASRTEGGCDDRREGQQFGGVF